MDKKYSIQWQGNEIVAFEVDGIQYKSLDDVPDEQDRNKLLRLMAGRGEIGGAGIHFTSIRKRYRVMFNFLEYPRLVLALKKQMGPVRDVVFSTRHAVEIEQFIKEATSHE